MEETNDFKLTSLEMSEAILTLNQTILKLKVAVDEANNPTIELIRMQLSSTLFCMSILSKSVEVIYKSIGPIVERTLVNSESIGKIIKVMQEKS
jgi:hypothetical protein